MNVGRARAGELDEVLELLDESDLPRAGVEDHFGGFLVARNGEGRLVGCIGIEKYEDVGLLRSLAVRAGERRAGVGRCLVERLLEEARANEIHSMFLLTTTAEWYFPRFGFQRIGRDEVDPRLGASQELRGACPESAVLMRLRLVP
ncbi:MAG TPA: arsenic resistance N-acetyltransferase ArsN2 [Vicinamibacteria bacterium]|nr:arsenic resistance N-acetyltransferase ArsN2 [Vicinamibacteria bacterium]